VDLGLTDRTFLVSGGTRGLGRAVAGALVAEGANVVVASRSSRHVEATVGELGERAAGVVADLTDADAPARLIATSRERFGRLDGAFVSHGGPPAGPAAELDDDRLRASLELATIAPIRLVRAVADELDAGGSIAVLTSSSSVQPIPDLASSNVTRPAVWAYVKTLADELAPRGIRMNVVVPGRFATERVAELDRAEADRTGRSLDAVRRDADQGIPLRRLGEPEELGRVAAFLLSDAASYVTGSAWRVDGGAVRGL
jgi:3-oxoacyl-[acyl-carrier protein] reductase